ncbi:MAG: serine/threonine-protein kinase, partial [Longimicrobiales bacterium]
MGTVYLAHDLKHRRQVAVKLLDPDAADALGAERFLAEIRTAARLNHPHILAVHDSGQDDRTLYYVMPCVEGESLRQRLDRESRLPVQTAVGIVRQVADALGYAHARGIVHRDVKPENILLDPEGHACLADFGLARALSSVANTRLTRSGLAVGSPAYMSPEQAAGEAHAVDGRCDVYSLGCVLFEMLTGEPPFTDDSVQGVLRRHLTEPPPSIRARRADVSATLDGVVRTALAKSPDRRYATAEAFMRALDEALGDPAGRRLGRWLRSRPPRVATFFAGALALLAYLAVDPSLSRLPRLGPPELDSMRIAVLPFRRAAGVPASPTEGVELHDAFTRWHDLEVVDRLQVGDALARRGGAALSTGDALDLARELRAGRYVHGSASLAGASI